MFQKILAVIDKFFDPSYKILLNRSKSNEKLKNNSKHDQFTQKIKIKVKNLIKKSEIFEYAKKYQQIPISDYHLPIQKLTLELLNDPDYQEYLLNNLKFNAEHEDFIPKKKPNIDNLLYLNINPILTELTKNHSEIYEFLKDYVDLVRQKVDIDEVFNSLTVISEEKATVKDLYFNKPFSELLAHQKWMFFDKIRKCRSGDFRVYFNDWTLKFSQIIESHVKSIFSLLLQIYLLIEGTSPEDITSKIRNFNAIGRILHRFDPNKKYENLDRIRVYRNATFHMAVDFVYDEKTNVKTLVFNRKGTPIRMSIMEFILNFENLILFFITMNFMIGHLLFKRKNNGKSIFQVNYDLAKRHGVKNFLKAIQKRVQEEEMWFVRPIL